ncbi:hypothetical protein PR048_007911 [Dryococelus australis]|uniref:Uncharacterized protein n=1 Tax=Dryococelus australis TaxID=614101 RepID=A0ABQ9HVL5_9NEOP|nr:hypothetical protein PR048_007911 [Dryococelus australis]
MLGDRSYSRRQKTSDRPVVIFLLIPRELHWPGSKTPVHSTDSRGRGRVVVRLLASHVAEPGSIPGGVTPEFSHVKIVPVDDAGSAGFLGNLPVFPAQHSGSAPRIASPSSALETSTLKSAQKSSLAHLLKELPSYFASVYWLDCAPPPPLANRVRFPAGSLPDDTTGRRVFSGIYRFPRLCIPAPLHSQPHLPSSALKTSMLRAAYICPLHTRNCEARVVLEAGLVPDWLLHAAKEFLLAGRCQLTNMLPGPVLANDVPKFCWASDIILCRLDLFDLYLRCLLDTTPDAQGELCLQREDGPDDAKQFSRSLVRPDIASVNKFPSSVVSLEPKIVLLNDEKKTNERLEKWMEYAVEELAELKILHGTARMKVSTQDNKASVAKATAGTENGGFRGWVGRLSTQEAHTKSANDEEKYG